MTAKVNETTMLIGVGAVALFVVYYVSKKTIGAIGNVNQGTPYQGYGAVGTLGNAANTLSGGGLASIGDWIGGKVADWTMPYNPNAAPAPQSSPMPAYSDMGGPAFGATSTGW